MRRLLLFQLFSFSAFQLFAANVYVGPSTTGSGSGADWSNLKAWANVTSFTRGNVYYLRDSDGTQYPDGADFATANSSTTTIIIRKATASDHGTETGWTSSMGDGQAYFEGAWDFGSGYWIIDGGWRNEQNWGDKTAYGICVTNNGTTCAYANPTTCRNLWFTNVTFLGNPNDPPDPPQGWRNFYITSWGEGAGDMPDCVWSKCLFKNGVNQLYAEAANVDNALVEYCYFDTTKNSDGNHGESINLSTGGAGGWIIRWNVWTNCVGTSVIAMNNNDGIEVYGNLFINGYGANGVFGYASDTGSDNNKFYNNTVVGDAANGGGVVGGTGNTAYNNLFVGNNSETISGTHDYNAFSGAGLSEANQQTSVATSIFVDYSGRDLRLASNTTGGTDLGAPYNVDIKGNTRTTWSRGALEYQSEEADETPPEVAAFVVPSTSTSLTVAILIFTATDAVSVTGYLVSESVSTPQVDDEDWSGSAQTQYVFASAGSKTLYAWAKDAAGNISSSLSDGVVITLPTVTVMTTTNLKASTLKLR